jgi:hypothetical protein
MPPHLQPVLQKLDRTQQEEIGSLMIAAPAGPNAFQDIIHELQIVQRNSSRG